MTAIENTATTPPPPAGRRPRAFTLTELLVVIALIALLVSLLLVAMGTVQRRSRQSTTLATMEAFSNACESFHQEHGFYPGAVPENRLAADTGTSLTSTENAMLSLMGGYARQADDPETYDELVFNQGWVEFRVDGDYRIKVNRNQMGAGPVINGKPYQSYLTPGDREVAAVDGQLRDPEPDTNVPRLPDLIDAWGQPIIYLRRQRSIGPITTLNPDDSPQFDGRSMDPYVNAERLGRLATNQSFGAGNTRGSILSDGADQPWLTLGKLLEHPALPGQTRGAYLLLSSGPDGIYLSAEDGPGTPAEPVPDVGQRIVDGLPPSIFSEYDDVLIFGGS